MFRICEGYVQDPTHLHYNVESEVQHCVCHENHQQIRCKVMSSNVKAENCQEPVTDVCNDQKYHPCCKNKYRSVIKLVIGNQF